jgi:hypothetical protein
LDAWADAFLLRVLQRGADHALGAAGDGRICLLREFLGQELKVSLDRLQQQKVPAHLNLRVRGFGLATFFVNRDRTLEAVSVLTEMRTAFFQPRMP